jgi:hypothetical protein
MSICVQVHNGQKCENNSNVHHLRKIKIKIKMIKKICYIYTMKHYLTTKITIYSTTERNLEDKKRPGIKGHMLYESMNMKCSKNANLTEIEGRLMVI